MSLSCGYLQTAGEHGGKRRIVMRAITDAVRVDNATVEHTLQAINRIKHMLEAKATEQGVDAQEIESGIERLMNCEMPMRRTFGLKTENNVRSL